MTGGADSVSVGRKRSRARSTAACTFAIDGTFPNSRRSCS